MGLQRDQDINVIIQRFAYLRCLTSAPMGPNSGFAKRGFVAHPSHQGVDDEKDNEEPGQEDLQRHQAGNPQGTVSLVRRSSGS